ncbi:hypothetical protein CPAR01_12472 [Colletotrichum paranaense]|uniref:Uncharacterized protein n=1 Tax=Colletotrichum paranaense TaxID=1914294 RepID=A0ABQ9S6I1_9PEZI|nr:uncharacterized protein CPAR01_12472 [Colletotrichum paranaense]KAK1527914.1 hypothetical protein CPAR01_12472 [Colletotrichum paranaense]
MTPVRSNSNSNSNAAAAGPTTASVSGFKAFLCFQPLSGGPCPAPTIVPTPGRTSNLGPFSQTCQSGRLPRQGEGDGHAFLVAEGERVEGEPLRTLFIHGICTTLSRIFSRRSAACYTRTPSPFFPPALVSMKTPNSRPHKTTELCPLARRLIITTITTQKTLRLPA